MSNVSEPPDPFETIIAAYADATTPADRKLYLRSAVRRLEHDAELHAARLKLLLVASAGEGNA